MEDKRLKEIIKKGKWNFVLIDGMLRWGIIMTIFFLLFQKFVFNWEIDSFTIISTLVIFLIGGLVWGLWVWNRIEKQRKTRPKKARIG
jgi:hypothetical protein